jgi:hypothetical protein
VDHPQALLELAEKLFKARTKRLEEVACRRTISTAYYALFHLLSQEVSRLFAPNDPQIGVVISRIPDHQEMRIVSGMFSKGQLPDGLNQSGSTQAVPEKLRLVAKSFVDLQIEREAADYDFGQRKTVQDAVSALDIVTIAFDAWREVRDTDMARLYLASLLYRKAWNQSRQPAKKPKADNPQDAST